MPIGRAALILAAFCVFWTVAGPSRAAPVEFVVLGDIPYGKAQIRSLEYIGERIRKAGYPFVIHYGDLKAGDAPCDNGFLADRRKRLFELVADGLFYTPGDNDWTDCDRAKAGGFDELERLAEIRRLFFTEGLPSNPAWRVARQGPDYPENARWAYRDLLFVTLHIVGTDNGRIEILRTDPPARALDAVDARDRANLLWLEAAFEDARRHDLAGLVVVIHADPAQISQPAQRNRPCGPDERVACNPYLPFLRRLTAQADRFDRPVLLVHGSTSSYCLDEGFGGWDAVKLARLNGPGDFVIIDAAVVRFDPEDPSPFQVRGFLTGDPAPPCGLQERAE